MNEYDIEVLKKRAQDRVSQTLYMDRFCTIPNQKATICRHFPCELGCYHNHDFFEINYVKKGDCVNFIEDKAVYMSEGSFILLHTNVFHTLYAPNESCMVYNVLLRKDWFLDTVRSYPLPDTAVSRFITLAGSTTCPEYVFSPSSSNTVSSLMTSLFESRANVSLYTEGQILCCLSELIKEERSVLSPRRQTSDETMLKILSFINQNFNSVTMDSLSKHIGYSKTHICRLFSKHLRKSFGDTVKSIRLEHAEYFLRATDRPVSEISALIGYENTEHFCRIFKNYKGVSPSKYRQSHRFKASSPL